VLRHYAVPKKYAGFTVLNVQPNNIQRASIYIQSINTIISDRSDM